MPIAATAFRTRTRTRTRSRSERLRRSCARGTLDEVSDDLGLLDVSLRAQWAASKTWSLSGGVSYAITSEEDRVLVDIAVTYRW